LDLLLSKHQSSIENLYLHGCFTDNGFVNIDKCKKIKILFILNEHFITNKSMEKIFKISNINNLMYNQHTGKEDIIDLKHIFQNSNLPNLAELALRGVQTNFHTAAYFLPNWLDIILA
jgi:hypothetical protein